MKIKIELPVDEIVNLYVNEEWSINDIAKKYNVDWSTIKDRLTREKVEFKNKRRKKENAKRKNIKLCIKTHN